MADTYDLTFVWPHTEPNDVVVTGTFDDWSSSLHLSRTDTGFEGKVSVPWGSKVVYKFRLDGDWIVLEDQPTEIDPIGNVNNLTYAPEKPVTAHAIKAARSGSTIIVDKDKAVPAYTVPTPASIAASLSQSGDAGAGNVTSEPEPMSLDPVLEEKHSPDESATVAPDVPVVIEPVVDKSLDTTASPEIQSKAAEGDISTHTPAPEGTVDTSTPAEEPKTEAKEEVTTPLPEPKDLATSAAAAASEPLPPTPAAAPVDAPAVPPKSPSTPPPVPADSEKPTDSAPATPVKANGTTSTPATSAPSTPKKTAFPSGGDDDQTTGSPSSVRSRLGSVRKKRLSIIDKIKSVFHHEHHHEHHDNENGEEHKEGETKEKEKEKKKFSGGTIRRTSLFKSHSASNNGNDAK